MSEFTGKLIRKAASGDQNAITELYELTYSSVYKTVRSMIADEDTVLDVVQDSFIKGFQSLDQLDTPENFRAWMKRIATNKAKDYLKKKKPILFTDMANEDGEEPDFRDDCLDHSPEEVLDREETTRLMQEILATLSEDQRLVIGMFYYEEMSVREIAETLGCSENTVKSRLNYGRKKVEAKVKELEKNGTKLYSMAPLPFLLWLFRKDAEVVEIPSGVVLEAVTAECAATGVAAAGSAGAAAAVGAGAKAAAGAGAKALTTKIIAGVLAASVVSGGTMLALSSKDREEAEPTQQIVSAELVSPTETTVPETTAETVPAITEVEQDAADTAEETAEDLTALTGLYGSIQEGCGLAVSVSTKDSSTLIVEFSDPVSSEELQYEVNYEDGFWKLWVKDDLMFFDFTYREGYLFIEGTAPDELKPHLGIFEKIESFNTTVSEFSFDIILEDIQAALAVSTEDYDSNMEYYDGLYSHLGEGVLWMLLHRQAGDYTMCIWNTDLDMDGDGQEELCIGRGVSPSNAAPIVIYTPKGEAICGDALYAYADLFYGGAPIEWNYLGG